MSDVICPFCGEKDFDLLGLEMHLERNWCSVFGNVKNEKKCTEERPCINCFADSGPCLGPMKT